MLKSWTKPKPKWYWLGRVGSLEHNGQRSSEILPRARHHHLSPSSSPCLQVSTLFFLFLPIHPILLMISSSADRHWWPRLPLPLCCNVSPFFLKKKNCWIALCGFVMAAGDCSDLAYEAALDALSSLSTWRKGCGFHFMFGYLKVIR